MEPNDVAAYTKWTATFRASLLIYTFLAPCMWKFSIIVSLHYIFVRLLVEHLHPATLAAAYQSKCRVDRNMKIRNIGWHIF